MENQLADIFIQASLKNFRRMVDQAENCLSRLSDEQIWLRGTQTENSIGNLILHLCGNARQWIISGVGGAADQRDRDSEFQAQGGWTREQLVAHFKQTTGEVVDVIAKASAKDLAAIVHPQGNSLSALEAIYHVVTHFYLHTGQVIFATKAILAEDLALWSPKRPV